MVTPIPPSTVRAVKIPPHPMSPHEKVQWVKQHLLWINKSFEYQWEAALMQQQVTDGASDYLFFFGTWYLGSLKPPYFPNPKLPLVMPTLTNYYC